jgi:hypothetical protein
VARAERVRARRCSAWKGADEYGGGSVTGEVSTPQNKELLMELSPQAEGNQVQTQIITLCILLAKRNTLHG